MEHKLSTEEQVLIANYRQLCDEKLQLQIELNKVAQERDHYKSELEKVSEKPAE
ncbi:hypothetical protein [Nosocomiicoccus massiliensis]|uniref:hypothetical protein n=1 Tax=Nosocomiicoccus massiliensis TaxID=1232430 RepID=UPI00040FDD94|nr:hypothetical protein [Nosocomiicoccus massiliensis]